jgi:hypothetical protein
MKNLAKIVDTPCSISPTYIGANVLQPVHSDCNLEKVHALSCMGAHFRAHALKGQHLLSFHNFPVQLLLSPWGVGCV